MGSDVEVRDSDVAIVGMACRFPGADTVEQFWANLCEGRDSAVLRSDEELRAQGVPAELLAEPRYVKTVQTIPGVDLFDADLFGVPREEAAVLDPQQRHLLECSLAALEDAGYDSARYSGVVGVFTGTGMNTFGWHHLADRFRHGSTVERYRLMLASDKDYAATRISYKLNLHGPSVNVNTACSTSLVAVHMACLSLLGGECDMALVGAAHIKVPAGEGFLYQEGMILSPDGRCRAFDAKAQGTILGDGVGAVVLKRLAQALDDGDTVHAVIKGTAINNDGARKPGYTAPSVEGQAAAIADAHAVADCPASTIGYVEAHGTGTALGDPVEVAALNLAFAGSGAPSRSCALGSVKTNVGHLDVAAGMAGLIKAALMVRHGRLVPSLHFESPNGQIDFAGGPFYVNVEPADWPARETPRRAGVSSFGVGGTNAHVVLEEPPRRPDGGEPPRPELFVLSAATPDSLDRAAAALARQLRRSAEGFPLDVAGTLALGRAERRYRRVLVAEDLRDAAMCLALDDRARVSSGDAGPDRPSAGRPVALVCSGALPDGGAHAVRLHERHPAFRDVVDDCLARAGRPGAAEVLARADAVAAALVEYALGVLWQSWGADVAGVVGLGDGWRAAGCLAGLFGVETMLDPSSPGPSAGTPDRSLWLPAAGWLEPGVKFAGGVAPGSAGGPAAGAPAVPPPSPSSPSSSPAAEWWPLALHPPAEELPDPGLPGLLTTVGEAWLAGVRVDWERFYADRPVRRVPLPTYPFERRRHWPDDADVADTHRSGQVRQSLAAALAACPPEAKVAVLIRNLQDEMGNALDVEAFGGSPPDPDVDLFDLGVESLMLIELTERLSLELGIAIPATSFIEHPTIRAFATNLDQLVGAADA